MPPILGRGVLGTSKGEELESWWNGRTRRAWECGCHGDANVRNLRKIHGSFVGKYCKIDSDRYLDKLDWIGLD